MVGRFLSEFARTGFVLPPLVVLGGSRHLADRGGGGTGLARAFEDGLRAFFERSGDPMIILDSSLRVAELNAAACDFLRVAPDGALHLPALEIRMLARLLAAAELPEHGAADGTPRHSDVSLTDEEGQTLQCHVETIPLDDQRRLVHLHDTTALLRVRSALEKAEHVHDAVFEAMPETAWSMALPEERLLEVSGSVERMFGYQPAEFRHRPELWDELVHPADRERVRGEFRRGLTSGRPFEIEFTGMHRDHRDLPSLVNRVVPVIDSHGWMDRCEGFIEDRSTKLRLESHLRSTETNLRHVLDSVSSGVLVVADGGEGAEIVLCNRRFADMLRLDATPEPGTRLDRAPAEVRLALRGPEGGPGVAALLASEAISDEIIELTAPHRVFRRFAAPLRDPLGAVVGRIVTLEDATSSWMLQRRLTHAQKLESLGRLAGGVGHDFNNLLGTVMGFASLLLEESPAGDPRREALEQVVHAAERASRLTGALLDFSRHARYERLPVLLNRVVEDSYVVLRSGLDAAIAIELELDPQLPPLPGDALLFQQMLVNLVQEAGDRLGGGGTVRIRTRMTGREVPAEGREDSPATQPAMAIEILAEPPAEGATHAMSPAADWLEPEARSGVPLSIVEDIVRAHGGFLTVGLERDAPLFQVTFPVETVEELRLFVPEASTAHGHETILVVDDEPGLRALAKAGLQHRGFDVVVLESGEQALDLIRQGQSHVDLVLLDLSMPGLSGEKVLSQLTRLRPDLPVIIASGYASVQSQSSWTAAGAAGFVAKPYRVQDLALKVREVLDRARPGAPL